MMMGRLVFAIILGNCFWLLLLSRFISATKAEVNCLKTIKSQVEDPNDSLRSWDFGNQTTPGFICKFSGVTCWHGDENRVFTIKLSGYRLGGVFPLGVKTCSDLTGLDLSRNNFSGPLPPNLTSVIPLVTTLDLSYNSFSGEIPATISNITFLGSLMLQNNEFTGTLPPQLVELKRLKNFSVANNHLVGPIPNFTDYFKQSLKFGPESFENNQGLCGKPLEDCNSPSSSGDKVIIIAALCGFTGGAIIFGVVLSFYFPNMSLGLFRRSRMILKETNGQRA